jgi:serine/threonine protein kinase/tetratricopeptide (TPR) repeat protein
MTNTPKPCPKCGTEIPADAPEGGCPGCLLESGLNLLSDEAVARGVDAGLVDKPARTATKSEHATKILGELGDYELLEEIGRGGQGVVFRARQKSLHRTVALKIISLGQWASIAHVKRFQREAEAAASLDHPGIVPIHEVGERDGSCYFSMQFIEGGQLDEVIRRKPMSIRQAAEFIAKVARTVHYAHEHGILHRDIKPGNILLDRQGEPHLTDFGLARLVQAESTVTRTLEMLGTPSYMAPEQATGKNAEFTSATDVYGLGAVLYQLLTGHPPFAGGATYETIKLLLDTDPRPPRQLNPKIDRELSTICLKCLEKDSQRRYPSALALAEDLEHWLRHEPIQAKPGGLLTHGRKWVRRNPSTTVQVTLLVCLAVGLSLTLWDHKPTVVVPKSVAVLPFENLSEDPNSAYFADGIQEEILTRLAGIADLKVISRTSVMQYKTRTARNVRKIGHELGVAHVAEGSVQRADNRVRVNAQLIDVSTNRELWGQTYDRDLADVFAIQSEIATSIAHQLQARLSAQEKAAIEQAPTNDIPAFELYARAKNLLADWNAKANLLEAVDLLNRAVVRDPSFFKAYCLLASTEDRIYFFGDDHTPARLALAEAAIQEAFRLQPDAGEAHLARAQNLYRGYLDYDGALAELEVAGKTLPNDANVFELKGYVQRRQGKQEEAVRSLKRAIDLDPRNSFMLQQIALSYRLLHRFAEQKSALERALVIEPNDADIKLQRAAVEFYWKADPHPLHQMLDSIRPRDPAAAGDIAEYWLLCALAERDAAAASNAVIAAGENPALTDEAFSFSSPFMQGVIARMTKDDAKARAAFTAARAEQQKVIQAHESYGPPLCVLGLIDAALGQKEKALREGQRAVELLPVKKDPVNGIAMIKYLAMIAAWVGDKDLACEQLAVAMRPPSGLSYGELKLLPFWDPLRNDPRFEKIVVSLGSK